jgi:predicted lipoprotein with Yx(FWY)xxD motif
MRAMRFLVPTLAASILLAACGSSSKTSSSAPSSQSSSSQPSGGAATAAVVKTASNAKLGATVLVNAQGLTLYRLSGETNGKFICTGASCLQVWHPLTVSAGATPSGVGSLGTVKRPDGATQVTYKGEPLYTFTQDTAPGQVGGQGFKDVGTWNAVTTSTASPSKTSSPAASAPAAPAPSGGGGYGY